MGQAEVHWPIVGWSLGEKEALFMEGEQEGGQSSQESHGQQGS